MSAPTRIAPSRIGLLEVDGLRARRRKALHADATLPKLGKPGQAACAPLARLFDVRWSDSREPHTRRQMRALCSRCQLGDSCAFAHTTRAST